MTRVWAGLAAGAMWFWAAMPAAAQLAYEDLTEEQMIELYCVADYLDLTADPATLTDAYISGDEDSAAYKEAIGIVAEAGEICDEDYGWSDNDAGLLTLTGLYTVLGDHLEVRLITAGLDQEDLDAIYGAADVLPAADVNLFVDGVWVDDAGLRQRMTAALAKKGIGGEPVITDAMHLIEAYIISSVTVEELLAGLKKS